MNKNSIILACVFVVCFAIGFGMTKFALPHNQKKETAQAATATAAPAAATASPVVDRPTPDKADKPVASKEVKLTATTPVASGAYYSFVASCENVPEGIKYHYELWSTKKEIAHNTDGKFSGITASPSGKYVLCLVNSETKEALARIDVDGFVATTGAKMSAAAFQRLLLNHNDTSLLGGKNPQVAKAISFSFTGMNEGDSKPYDVLSIRTKIANGIWMSATVVSVGYDDQNKINSAVVKPIY